jgi:integrase
MRRPNLRIVPISWHPRYHYTIAGYKVNGKRARPMFETETAAKDELRRLQIKHNRQGEEGLNMSDSLRVAALECTKLLRPFNKTIYDATRYYLDHLEAGQSELTSELVRGYITSKKRAGLSRRHLDDIESRLNSFSESFGSSPIKTLTAREIEDWLYAKGALAPQTLINWRATLHAFFKQLFKEKIIVANPAGAVQKPKHVRPAPLIFTPNEITRLVGTASDELRPCIAIQAFAGLRTSEVLRLDWRDVGPNYIKVNAENAKTSKRRLVKVLPPLAAWLAACKNSKGKLWHNGFRSYHASIAELCRNHKLKWKHNGLRHSFASYHLSEYANADALAEELGHVSGRIVRDHYREVVTPEAAHQYWAIYPDGSAGNIIRFQAKGDRS